MNEDALPLEEYQAFMARQRAATAPESHSNESMMNLYAAFVSADAREAL